MRTDICVAGGGPAGLAAAIALRREGFGVAIVDCAVPPIDKACGEGLMPAGIAALRDLGVTIPPGLGRPFEGIRFSDRFSTAEAKFSCGPGLGIRRTELHRLLVQKAAEAGVIMIWGAKRVRLASGGISTGRQFVEARVIVGADGQNSAIRRQGGLDRIQSERHRFAFRKHYRIAPWSDHVEVWWGARRQIYVTPLAKDEVCVATVSRDRSPRLDGALAEFPEIQKRLAKAIPISTEMGAVTASRRLRCVHGGNVALVGDASGSVDAVTGQGLELSFKQAAAFAQSLRAGDPRCYQREHEAMGARTHAMAALLLSLDRHPAVRLKALATLAKWPKMFQLLLDVHNGQTPGDAQAQRARTVNIMDLRRL
jgi:menaquinone-9 beta-reductase